MSTEAKFVDGLRVYAPHERAPNYVKARLSMNRIKLIAWLMHEEGEWINADVKVSKSGKWYAAVDNWKPKDAQSAKPKAEPQGLMDDTGSGFQDDDPDRIPF